MKNRTPAADTAGEGLIACNIAIPDGRCAMRASDAWPAGSVADGQYMGEAAREALGLMFAPACFKI